MVDGGMSCIKYILFVFNLIFVLLSAGLVYLGVTIIQDNSTTWSQVLETPNTIAIGAIVLGFLIFLIAFLGCCGALVESHCILLTFGIIVTVILTLEVTIAGLAFAFKADLRTAASRELREVVTRYNWTDPTSRYSEVIDTIQRTMHCCGVNSSTDWTELNPFPGDSSRLPDSCCPLPPNRVSGREATLRDTLTASMSTSSQSSDRNTGSCRAPLGSDSLLSRIQSSASGPSSSIVSQAPPFSADSGFLVGNEDSPAESKAAAQQTMDPVPFTANCTDVFVDGVLSLIGPLGLLCVAIAMFQLLGIIFAFSLSKAVRREYQVV